MSIFLAANNATTTLAGAINTTATTLSVATGTGALFPSPTTGQYFVLTLVPQTSTTGTPNEVMWCTNVTSDTLTVIRGQEGTSPRSFAVGDFVTNQLTAGQIGGLLQPGQAQAQSGTYYVDTGAANAYVITPSPAVTALVDGMSFNFRPIHTNTGSSTLAVGSSGTIAIELVDTSAVPAGAITVGTNTRVVYSSATSKWVLVSSTMAVPTYSQGVDNTFVASTAYVDRQAASTLTSAETYAASVASTAQSNAETYAAANFAPLSSFLFDIADPGYYVSERGIYFQWGNVNLATGNADVIYFSVPFPNALLSVTLNEAAAQNWAPNAPTIFGVNLASSSTTAFIAYALHWTGSGWTSAGANGNYFAVGF